MNPVLKRVVTGLTVSAAVILAILFAPPAAFKPVCMVLAMLAIVEVGQLTKLKANELMQKGRPICGAWLVGALLAAAVAAMFSVLPDLARLHGNVMLLYVIAIVKFSDTGGFVFGLTAAKLLKGGTHKLCPTISPNKSWEGLIGSLVFSVAVSCLAMPLTGFGMGKAVVFGVTAALVGTFGDLVESKFKRWVGVKDSSTMRITNGMGGFLDMFDSLLFAPAVLLPFI